MTDNAVYIVHCIDTEGPLYESVDATFERLRDIFQLELEPSSRLLRQLQAGEVPLGGLEAAVQKVVDPSLLAYNDTWDKVDAMLAELMHESFRTEVCDSAGTGWIYNWFCVDHVDYDANPRRRDIGYHNIFEHYSRMMQETGSLEDGLHFHYHPHSFRREAHRCATHWWASSDSLHQVLSRRVIDHGWFPAAHRPGFHVIRPDSHWFLSSTSRLIFRIRLSHRPRRMPRSLDCRTDASETGAGRRPPGRRIILRPTTIRSPATAGDGLRVA